ncbi:hypothetical protein GGP86_000559 [Salinibacter ruber]|uniref:hypothetical protein n=1 Tax=Salinibacter ruber TaxID=146919 RepID=UPI00216A5024|nr:hypothetical protein [Salinibacter ruber]MCS3642120.1 hypothetical protein [Salinibacter ruber]MCS3749827.1 hypothetical protein [Salinibacter ruber]MCS3860811.1 hypothetical protein [Salinibacter ruber]MCS3938504.1 hypothetical protein [Salinibacter ruber]
MGQQQLLLLVLSTVIVGLATVAGIQAFSDNQAQASQDALVQKGTSIASDIQGLYGKPAQLGGVDDFSKVDGSAIGNRLGYGGATVDAEGAGSDGECTISTSSDQASVACTSGNAPQKVTVTFDPDNTDDDGNSRPVTTSFTSSSSS